MLGTACNSHHQASMSTYWPCHSIHLQWSLRGGLGHRSCQGPASLLLPAGVCTLPRSIQDLGQERIGAQGPLLLACSCWMPPHSGLGKEPPTLRCPPCAMILEGGLSSKPGRAGWGGPPFYRIPSAACCWGNLLFIASWQVPPVAPWTSSTMQMLATTQLPTVSRLSMGDGAAQPLNVALQQGSCCQHLAVGILSYPQGLLKELLPSIPEMVRGCLHSPLELGLGVCPRSASWSLLWFLQLGRTPPMPEVLL